jgi:nucleolar protein 4
VKIAEFSAFCFPGQEILLNRTCALVLSVCTTSALFSACSLAMAPGAKRQKLSSDGTAAETPHEPEQELSHSKTLRRQLFVRSLPANTTSDDLTEHFSQIFPIKHAVAVTDPSNKQCIGYGFVTFADAEDAQRAKEEFDGSTLLGKKIKVEAAEPRHRGDAEGKTDRPPKKEFGKQHDESQPPPKLIVRNLPWSIDSAEKLTTLFLSFGKVNHAVVPKTASGKMRGFGIVLLRGRKNAEKALAGVNGKQVDGRTLAVDWAVDKETWQHKQGVEDDTQTESARKHNGGEVDQADENGSSSAEDEEHESRDIGSDAEASIDESFDGDSAEGSDISDERLSTAPSQSSRPDLNDTTLFIRNLPFTTVDEDLEDHFSQFGPLRYARVVEDAATGRSRGTGFVCFRKKIDAQNCLRQAPKAHGPVAGKKDDRMSTSVLQDENLDSSGLFTMDGRVLQVTQAVQRSEAVKLTEEGVARRNTRDKDNRRLYLLSEGSIATNSPIYQTLSHSEIAMRKASAKQRKALIESNPSLHLSLTRLSVRNIPRSVSSKELKALAREAVVGFAKDVKAGLRQPLSKEELERGGEEMKVAEKNRKEKGKGVVKQAKIVFEGRQGEKVEEVQGAGRSRGYGFIEYSSHRHALMGLRWLNGHAVEYKVDEDQTIQERKKRLIVEFALENAQVVKRRKDREARDRDRPKTAPEGSVTSRSERKTENDKSSGRSATKAGKNPKAGFKKTAKLQRRGKQGGKKSSRP